MNMFSEHISNEKAPSTEVAMITAIAEGPRA